VSTPLSSPAASEALTAPATDDFQAVAQAIAARLARTAVWHNDRCNWVGGAVDNVNGTYQMVRRTFGPDLYNGTAGVAWFLSQLLARHPDALLADTLAGAVQHLLTSRAAPRTGYGYYGGALGTACTLLEVGEQQQRPDWLAAGWERLAQVLAEPLQETEVDVIAGAAGAIPALLRLGARHQRPELLDAAARCGDFLVARALRQPTAWAWNTLPGQTPLTGYSHGAAGVALALLELYQKTGQAEHYTGAMMGFNYERLLYNPQLQNWPDLRSDPGAPAPAAPAYGEAWCHGAPGVALSRVRAWQLTGDDTFRQEAEAALSTTHRGIYGLVTAVQGSANMSLCHGLAGNADIMLEASQVLGNPVYRQVAEAAGYYGLERYHRPGLRWPSGVNDPSGATLGQVETPGLMQGLAGTGYFYLRLASPAGSLASVLRP
jgi:lantibiotic modifying enzyme